MNLSKRVPKVVCAVVASLILLAGSSRAQEPSPQLQVVGGLQMRLYVDQAKAGRSNVPTFRVELRNAGDSDLVLNLGTLTSDGRQFPTAVSLVLVNAQGKPHRLELKSFARVSDAAKRTLLLPLPVGGTFSFPVNLNNYWSVASRDFDRPLKPGAYSIRAQFTGFIETSIRQPFPEYTEQMPRQRVLLNVFDAVGHIDIPTSNKLQFEVSSR